MKTKLAIIIFVFSCIFIFLPIPPKGRDGAYNLWSGLIYCRTDTSCIHEVGHKLDDEAAWISHSKEFSLAVSAFVWFELDADREPHPFVYKIMTFPGVFRNTPSFFTDDNAELYASLFQWAEGKEKNMPERLRPFYDWERAAELIEKVIR